MSQRQTPGYFLKEFKFQFFQCEEEEEEKEETEKEARLGQEADGMYKSRFHDELVTFLFFSPLPHCCKSSKYKGCGLSPQLFN